MARRELEEINASSMADIAFLLLVFFLVTTTLNKEKVQEERLPQKTPPDMPTVLVNPVNVLEIIANKNDQILLENEYSEIEEITERVIEFYIHPKSENGTKWPPVTQVSKQLVDAKLQSFKSYLAAGDATFSWEDSVAIWEKKYTTIEVLGGPYNEISEKAIVTITVDNSTKFNTYLSVYDAILKGINQLREELCQSKFDRPYNSLDDDIPEDEKIKKAIDAVYPKRVMKAKGTVSAEAGTGG